MSSNVIYLSKDDKLIEPENDLDFQEWLTNGYKGIFPKLEDLSRSLTMLFPDVRPRNFLELRSVDMQSKKWQVVPMIFFTGLLYDQENLDYICEQFVLDDQELSQLRLSSAKGLNNKHIRESSNILMLKAIEGFERVSKKRGGGSLCQIAQKFYETYTSKGLVPADELITSYTKKNTSESHKNLHF